MNTYEFSTKVSNGTVVIPQEYVQDIPRGRDIRVILVVDEATPAKHENGIANQDLQSLEELVAEIQSMPTDPANITPASGLLAEHLANPVTEPDPDFDEETWNHEWARIEAEMKASSLAHEQEELKTLFPS